MYILPIPGTVSRVALLPCLLFFRQGHIGFAVQPWVVSQASFPSLVLEVNLAPIGFRDDTLSPQQLISGAPRIQQPGYQVAHRSTLLHTEGGDEIPIFLNGEERPVPAWALAVFFGIVGGIFSSIGGGGLEDLFLTQHHATRFKDENCKLTNAYITLKTYSRTESKNDFGGDTAEHHYECNFWFEVVRADGVTCKVVARNHGIPGSYWRTVAEESWVQVIYMPKNLQQCRLKKAAELDYVEANDGLCYYRLCFWSVFFLIGTYWGAFVPIHDYLSMTSAILVAPAVWLCMTGIVLIVCYLIFSPPGGGKVQVTELGENVIPRGPPNMNYA